MNDGEKCRWERERQNQRKEWVTLVIYDLEMGVRQKGTVEYELAFEKIKLQK